MPIVSVVLPVHNGATTLPATLDSILLQDFGDYELLIVDDGSTDRTNDILSRYQQSDTRIKVIRTPQQGVARAPNTALAVATGEYVARIDADDVCHPSRFDLQVKYLLRNPDCVAVGSGVLLIDVHGEHFKRQPRLGSGVALPDRCRSFAHFPPSPPTIYHSTAMIRRNALEEVGRYRACFNAGAEDRDLWWRLSQVGEIHRLPTRLVQYREHVGSFSSRNYAGLVIAALVADLSAAARHFSLDDRDILERSNNSSGLEVASLQEYAALLDGLYPVRALVCYRAKRRRIPEVASWIDRAAMRREVAHEITRRPINLARLSFLEAAFV